MRRVHFWLVAALALAAFPAHAEKAPDWLKSVTVDEAGAFPPPRPVQATYRASWSGIIAGRIATEFSGDQRQLRLRGKGETSGLARVLFRLDAVLDSTVDRQTLRPLKTRIVETYSDEKRETLQTFDPGKVRRSRSTRPRQKDDGKVKTIKLPGIFDLQSALLHIRSQPLRTGDKMVFLAYGTASPYLATVTVDGPETITVPAGKYETIRLDLKLQSIDKKKRLSPYSGASEIKIWLSDDADRLLVKTRGELFIGAVLVELEKAAFP